MSDETSHKFFEFMKKLACTCDDLVKDGKSLPDGFDFNTTLNLCDFKTASEFVKGQKGDKYLEE